MQRSVRGAWESLCGAEVGGSTGVAQLLRHWPEEEEEERETGHRSVSRSRPPSAGRDGVGKGAVRTERNVY